MEKEWTGKGSVPRNPNTEKYTFGHAMAFGPKTEVYLWADYEYCLVGEGAPFPWKSDDYIKLLIPDILFEEGNHDELMKFFRRYIG